MAIFAKRSIWLVLVILLLVTLAGCQQVVDTRTQFCQNLREIGTQAAEFKNTKIDQPLADLQAKTDRLQTTRTNLNRLAKLTNIETVDKLNSAVDQIASAVTEFKSNAVDPVVAKITAAADQAVKAYQDLNDAVCAAK